VGFLCSVGIECPLVFWQHKSLVVNLEQFYMPGKTLFAIAKILDVENENKLGLSRSHL
jgi:hypothetical protein